MPSSFPVPHPMDRSNSIIARSRLLTLRHRALLLATMILMGFMVIQAQPLVAQDSPDQAKGMVSSVASFIYNLAWPTATYRGFQIENVEEATDGYDVPIVLYGNSFFGGGDLRMELVLKLRHGTLSDLSVRWHNAIIAPPFQTSAIIAGAVVAIGEQMAQDREHDQQTAAMLVGTWRDENSVFTFTSDGRWSSDWDDGSRATGTWRYEGGTLTWYFSSGTIHRLTMLSVDNYNFQTRDANGVVWNARRIR